MISLLCRHAFPCFLGYWCLSLSSAPRQPFRRWTFRLFNGYMVNYPPHTRFSVSVYLLSVEPEYLVAKGGKVLVPHCIPCGVDGESVLPPIHFNHYIRLTHEINNVVTNGNLRPETYSAGQQCGREHLFQTRWLRDRTAPCNSTDKSLPGIHAGLWLFPVLLCCRLGTQGFNPFFV